MAARVRLYGDNKSIPFVRPSFLDLIWNALDDTSLRILILASIVSLIVGLYEDLQHGWLEGVAILSAVIAVLLVTSTNDYLMDKQLRTLSEKAQEATCTVTRNGKESEISVYELVVGDVVNIKTGMVIPADGLVIEGFSLVVNEEIDGNNHVAKKEQFDMDEETTNPFLLSGSLIEEGTGRMLVCSVGRHATLPESDGMAFSDSSSRTALQDKLEAIADSIGKYGFYAALLILMILVAYVGVDSLNSGEWTRTHSELMMKDVIVSVAILVVAIPEGLPLAVTLSLAFSIGKMKNEQNLVRNIHACETMGGATDICTDKTGTITKNRMTVVTGYVMGQVLTAENLEVKDAKLKQLLVDSFAVNSDAALVTSGSETQHIGNRTECAFLVLANLWHAAGYGQVRKSSLLLTRIPFTPSLKYMCTIASRDDLTYVYMKGAPEAVLPMCCREYKPDGDMKELTQEKKHEIYENVVLKFAKDGLRPIAVAFKSGEFTKKDYIASATHPREQFLTSDLTLLGIFGIQDPIRDEVPVAVDLMVKAGINVRLLTGDNVETAIHVAKKCGILPHIYSRRADNHTIMEGAEFEKAIGEMRELTAPDGSVISKIVDMYRFTAVVNELKVLARCSPKQKFMLVTGLREMENKVVAVTGEGANDAPALRRADIGFAMNLSGTQLAKDAADIILLDDNFAGIITALKWGRNIYDSIKKFMQFQVTVCMVVIILCLVGCAALKKCPLTAVQLLWINLIMDTFAALALATEAPTDDVLRRRPYRKSENLIDDEMKKTILIGVFYQLTVLLVLLFWGPELFDIPATWQETKWSEEGYKHFTMIFSTFVYMQVCNEFNCRKLKSSERNMFKGLCGNAWFLLIVFVTVGVQLLFQFFGFGLGALLSGFLSRLVPAYYFSWIHITEPLKLPLGHSLLFSMLRRDPATKVGAANTAASGTFNYRED